MSPERLIRLLRSSIIITRYGSNTGDRVEKPFQGRFVDFWGFDISAKLGHLDDTAELFLEAANRIQPMPVRASLVFARGTLKVRFALPDEPMNSIVGDDPVLNDAAMALIVSTLLEAGKLNNVKRCESKDCRQFHVRRGKWCSDGCGSRERLRKKRKLDRERQML